MILWELKSKGQSSFFSENLVDVENWKTQECCSYCYLLCWGKLQTKSVSFIPLSVFISISSPRVCRGGLLLWVSAFASENGDTWEAQAWHSLRLERRGGAGCSIFGDGCKGRWPVLGFFWTLLPLRVRSGGTGGAGSSTEWEPARLMVLGWGTSTDVCTFPLSLADSKHKRDGNNPLQRPALQARG